MNYRYATILASKSLGTAGTETIDINVKDPISRLEIGHKPTLGDGLMAEALAAAIEKIELVDGSDVLHSLSGKENQALCIYDRRVPTMNDAKLVGGAPCYATYGIDFGRFLFDPLLAFDPTRFRNPQLKITHDSTNISANTATHTLEVVAHLFDEKKISPIGFLMSKEHYTYTPSAEDAYEYITLPTDHTLRQLLVRGFRQQYSPHTIVDHMKLSEDNDKRIPFDTDLLAYFQRMKGVWAQVIEGFTDYAASGVNYFKYVTPTDEDTQCFITGSLADDVCWHDGATKGGYVKRRSTTNTIGCQGMAFGYLPHHCYQVPFGDQKDIDDWYDVTKLGNLQLRLQSAADYSTSLISVVLQQLRKY